MPTVRVLIPPTAEAAPVSLALLKAQARVDTDAEDELLQVYLDAAREKVEAFTGRYFAPQQVELTFTLDEAYTLPAGATATAVSGFFTTLSALAGVAAYLSEYRKGISISRELPWSEALQQTYTVVADVLADPQFLGLAKRVMLQLAAESYKNREVVDLSTQWRVDLAPASLLPLGY